VGEPLLGSTLNVDLTPANKKEDSRSGTSGHATPRGKEREGQDSEGGEKQRGQEKEANKQWETEEELDQQGDQDSNMVQTGQEKTGGETPATMKKDWPSMSTKMGPEMGEKGQVECVVAPTSGMVTSHRQLCKIPMIHLPDAVGIAISDSEVKTGKRIRDHDCVRGSGGAGGWDGAHTTTTIPADSPMRPLVLHPVDAAGDVGDCSGGAGHPSGNMGETSWCPAKRARPSRRRILLVGFDSPLEQEGKGKMEMWVKKNGGALALAANQCTVCVAPRSIFSLARALFPLLSLCPPPCRSEASKTSCSASLFRD